MPNIIRQNIIQDGVDDTLLAQVNSNKELQTKDTDTLSKLTDIETNQTDKSQYTQISGSSGNVADVNSDGQLHIVAQGMLCTDNSTVETLLSGASWTGNSVNILAYNAICVFVTSDVNSAVDGLEIQYSKDGSTNWRVAEKYTLLAGSEKWFTPPSFGIYFRVKYTNGGTGQGSFELTTILRKVPFKWSSHNIDDPITDEDDATLIKAVNTSKSDLTGYFENVTSYRNALNVNTSLVHRIGISEHFERQNGSQTTLAAVANSGDTQITVASTTGIIIGTKLIIYDSTVLERSHFHVVAVASPVITLNRPIDNDFVIGDNVDVIETSMNQDGTLAAPLSFKIQPPASERWQITRMLITMLDSTPMDDGTFGGMTALTNGFVIREYNNGIMRTITHWNQNSDLKDDMFNVEYSSKAPAGQYGLSGRWTFTASEFVSDLNGATGDYLECLVQDALSVLDDFNIKGQGRLFSG